MKKLLLLLVMVTMGVATADAQKYYIPKFKKTKEVRDYELDSNRKIYLTLGASLNLGLGSQNHIKYEDHGYDIKYDEDMGEMLGMNALLGVGYRVTDNFHAGIEFGALVQDRMNAWPLYASLKYYYGPSTRQNRTRFFNYLNGGPQFYSKDNLKSTGYMIGAGGGMRLLLMKSMRADVYLGYQLYMRGVHPNMNGSEQVDPASISFRKYTHSIQIGFSVPIL